ncbi:MAG: S8 family serine peptidase [Bdellovibrionales bacterium]|nr:S8 family serine peptidase [Bdellovibrionales bacterium]
MKLLLKQTLGFLLVLAMSTGPTQGAIRKDSFRSVEELRNWGLDNKEGSHISARKAWRISKGKKQVVVAVIDTGIDPSHPELRDNLWKKPGTADEYGFDFVTGRKNPLDTNNHGTHVAGIIAAAARTGAGASGVAPQVSIMAIRYYDDNASGAVNLANTVKAINYAIDNGADVINYSGGGPEFNASEMKAIQRAEQRGILFVAASGNDFHNTDETGNQFYPASYGLPNIVSVAATNIHNGLASFSNWGARSVHVAAPGERIYSTFSKGRFGYLTGTSQATAFVSGIAALMLSEFPALKPAEIREMLMRSADRLDALKGKVASGGRVNAFAALRTTLALRDTGADETLMAALADNSDTVRSRENSGRANRKVAFK